MADDPNTGKDKPGIGTSIGGGLLGIVGGVIQGAYSVFNPPPSVTQIDVWKANGTWNNADKLSRARDRIEAKEIGGDAKQVRRRTEGRKELFKKIDDQLSVLESRGEVPADDFAGGSETGDMYPPDSRPSPVFNPVAFGLGGAILGIGSGGWDEQHHQREVLRIKKLQQAARLKKSGPVKFPRLPKTNLQKTIEGATKVLSKIPKSMLPDSELVVVAKTFGKALRGGFGGLAAQVAGTYAIEKGAAILAGRQFEKMTKILQPGDAYTIAQSRKLSKGPTSRMSPQAKAIQRAAEPPRPAPPGPPTTANARQVGQIKPPRAVSPTPSPIEEVTVKAQRITHPPVGFATPAMMKITPRVNKLAVIQKYANAIGSIGRSYLATRRPSSSRTRSNLLPTTRASSSASYFTNLAPASTGTGSGCYTVCRKKSTGRKKRNSPRVCVTKTQALKLGIRS